MSANRDEAMRLAAEIRQAITDYDGRLDGHTWGLHDYEHLRMLVMENDVEALAAAQRVLLPLNRDFTPGFIGSMVQQLRMQGVPNGGELVTRKSVTDWRALYRAVDQYGRSVGNPLLTIDDMTQELLLMAFTDPEITADEIVSVIDERGVLVAETVRGLVRERRNSVTALRTGSL